MKKMQKRRFPKIRRIRDIERSKGRGAADRSPMHGRYKGGRRGKKKDKGLRSALKTSARCTTEKGNRHIMAEKWMEKRGMPSRTKRQN